MIEKDEPLILTAEVLAPHAKMFMQGTAEEIALHFFRMIKPNKRKDVLKSMADWTAEVENSSPSTADTIGVTGNGRI